MTSSRRLAALAVLVCGVAACAVATPSQPAASRSSALPAAPSTTPSVAPLATASDRPAGRLGDLGALLDIRSVSSEFTARVLEFASAGSSIVASASERQGDDAAPDLYVIPSSTGQAQLAWRNPERDHSLVRLAGDGSTIAFVDMPVTGEAEWTLRLIPDEGAAPVVLDRLADHPDVPSLVPSVAVYWPFVAWTAFDRGPDGAVSQLLYAQSPDWEPTLIAERPAADAELWFPSLHGTQLVYTELVYSEDRSTDERRVWLTEINDPDGPERLDSSGLATMPVINQFAVAWKEGERGFHQLNWGSMERRIAETGSSLPMWEQEEVNYPSAGTRYMTWWTSSQQTLPVWDGAHAFAREIVTYDNLDQRVLRAHVAGSLIVWLFVDESVAPGFSEIRYAVLVQG